MKWTIRAKRLVGLDPVPVGVGSHQRIDHECTVCGTTFEVGRTACPECGSDTFRTKTTTPNALFNLFFAVMMAGFGIAYNILTGEYPKE